MVAIFIKRHKSMIRVSIFFFCLGCGISLYFIGIDCANAVNTQTPVFSRHLETSSVEYAVLVLTSPSNEERRNVIRSTWGNLVSNIVVENGEKLYIWNHSRAEKRTDHDFIKVFFVVGTKGLSREKYHILKTENTRTNDMVFLDNLVDKYENLSLKVKLSFVWLHENLVNLKYVMKCDDDSFVRVDLIVRDIEAYAPQMASYQLNPYISNKVKSVDHDKFVILSDSKSAHQHLALCVSGSRGMPIAYKILKLIHNLLSKNITIVLQWIPSHVGVHGNEQADELANLAIIHGEEMPCKPYSTELMSKARIKCHDNWQKNFDPLSKKKTGATQYQGLYWGYFNGHARVQSKGKWQEQDWFLCDNYLPYAVGGGYVVSRSIVDFIARNADYLSTYHSEDASMGVWTAPLDRINRVHDIRYDTEWISRGCLNHMLVRHKQTTQDMFQMYKVLLESKGVTLCKSETIVREAYEYIWNSRPSQCCLFRHHFFSENKEDNSANRKT